jgi:hypothetical protein
MKGDEFKVEKTKYGNGKYRILMRPQFTKVLLSIS